MKSSLLFVRTLKIEFWSATPSSRPQHSPLPQYLLRVCLLFCASPLLPLSCLNLYAFWFCSQLSLVVIIENKPYPLTLPVFLQLQIFIKSCLDFPKFWIFGVIGFSELYYNTYFHIGILLISVKIIIQMSYHSKVLKIQYKDKNRLPPGFIPTRRK